MDNGSVVALSRGRSLFRELDIVANNIANANVTGYRADKVLFTEYVKALGGEEDSLSLARAGAHFINLEQGALTLTGGPLDLAIEGDGFFVVETPAGERLTRAGAFALNNENEIVTQEGYRLQGEGGGAITAPAGGEISIAADGTISAGGAPVGRVGLVTAAADNLERTGDNLFAVIDGAPAPAEAARVAQGYVEASNVNPVEEIARLIEVQRAYETIQTLNQQSEDRIGSLIRAIDRNG